MIHELGKSEFYKCGSFPYELGNHIEVRSIIEGNNKGCIFVDDISSPELDLIWLGNNDGIFS